MTQSPVTSVEISDNSKLGKISATMSSQVTCPKSCPFFNTACYAQVGRANLVTNRLNQSPVDNKLDVLKLHADAIRKLSGRRMLRLNVVGDCDFDEGALLLAQAAKEHTSKHSQPVYTYTHGHYTKRESWGDISILRSCETMEQVKKAHADGFAAALVVESHSSSCAETKDGFTLIPCPQQTGKAKNCAACKLCSQDKKLHAKKAVIIFAVHGSRIKKAKEVLNSAQIP